ncbi:efflux RND transporter periplasmic adaptor subunit [Hymenobacter caeli]|uniref:RND family efflux transporter MFP subunit n=1 Tax=Hymenobacter caeli TaxID=2735894 RepID=A0ABX2FW79_9BACT|nr:efflux RND transporter periplasmic adaptor subunit [Hymenobacter caeli]NRT21465.1 RND family efflux transporter MFP subunit [Hymenobacter caeli]
MNFPALSLRALAALGLAASTALFAGCSSNDAAQGQNAADPTATPASADVRYDAVRVTATQPAQSLSLPGELDSYFQTDIMPRVSSYVKALHADIGDHVRQGQLLAELDAPELTAALCEARSKQSVAQASFQASRGTYRRLRQTARTAGAVSPLNLDQARTQATSDSLNVVAARAHYQAAAQMAAYLRLTAPMAGVITERNASPGALVGPGGSSTVPLFRLKQLSRLRLRVAVPEAYVGDIHAGNPVQFNVRTFPGRTFTGKIDRVAGNVTPGTRAETVEIDIPNPQEQLKPGMFASATIPIKSPKTSLYVPKSAVVSTAERTYVIRVVAGKTELVDVQKGDENAGQMQVFGSLKAGDVVLKAGNEEIGKDEPVQVALASR